MRRRAGARALASWLTFPALLSAVAAASIGLLEAGAPPTLTSLTVMLGSVVVLLVLERVAPLHPEWNGRPNRTDLLLMVANRAVDVGVVIGTLSLLNRLEEAGVDGALLHVWPTRWPLLAQAVLGVAVGEAFRYATHRAAHASSALWRLHRTHHQPERMYTLNGPRLHPANGLWIAAANTVPMLLLGARVPALFVATNLTVLFVLFQHSNLRLRFDGWNLFLATPDVHRRHHLRAQREPRRPEDCRPEKPGVNYALTFTFFDQLFGTYEPPGEEPAPDEIGLTPDGDVQPSARR